MNVDDGSVLVAGALAVLVMVAVPAVALAATGQFDDDVSVNETINDTGPGQQFAAVVGVGEAELENDIDQRAFNTAVNQAQSEQARAEVVAERLEEVENRLEELRQERRQLQELRENGELEPGQYGERITEMVAQSSALSQQSNQTAEVATELPGDVLENSSVDTDRIETLSEQANNLSGGEVSEIARGIAGGPDDRPASVIGPPEDERGPPDNRDEQDEDDEDDEDDEQDDDNDTELPDDDLPGDNNDTELPDDPDLPDDEDDNDTELPDDPDLPDDEDDNDTELPDDDLPGDEDDNDTELPDDDSPDDEPGPPGEQGPV